MWGYTMIAELVTEITSEGMMDAARFSNTTGKRAKLLRMDQGLKQGDVAERVGIRHPYLSEIENDKAYPSGEVIAKLAQALGTTTDYLLLLTDNPEQPKDAEPTRLSEEAEQAAQMIDDMYPYMRTQALGAVANIYAHYQEHAKRDKMIIELLNLIEMSNGPGYRRDLERRLGLAGRLQNNGEPPLLGLSGEPT